MQISKRQILVLMSCCTLQFLFGSLYAMSAFVPSAPVPKQMITVLGVMACATAIGISCGGVLLHSGVCLRTLSLLASSLQLSLLLVAMGLSQSMVWLTYFGAVMTGTSFGVLYIASITQLQHEFHDNPGVVTGIGMFSSSLGSIVLAFVYSVSQEQLTWLQSLFACGISMFLANSAASLSLTTALEDEVQDEEGVPLLSDQKPDNSVKLGIWEILRDPNLYYFLLCFSAAVGPGYGTAVGFQQMSVDVFNLSSTVSNKYFLLVTALGLVGRLGAGFGGDILKTEKGVFSNGALNVTGLLLVLQSVAILLMQNFPTNFYSFVICSCITYFVFAGGAVTGALLARNLFGMANGSLVFGFTGLAVGGGDLLSSWLIKQHAGEVTSGDPSLLSSYGEFIYVSIFWTLVGFVALVFIRKSKKAFPQLTCQETANVKKYAVYMEEKDDLI
ncbi:hypothetical protein NDN08_001250 [Rhodosorus marinus]|uniref:Major facilitator superfamily (MFS) profile domain-containing protein n=1 Tax=Rhodosorus marinus TaxID=101924 RepID=A0AAV8URS2_9RHOD|nr:hypothetical protein NDN08_001250 [Rhodosorus marinus]